MYNFFNDKKKNNYHNVLHCSNPPCIYALWHNKRHIYFSFFLINFRLYYNEQLVSIWNMSMTSYSLCVPKRTCLFVQYDLVFVSNSLHLKAVYIVIRGEKKTKPRKLEKKNWIVKKNRLKFWKNRPVRFGFGFINLKPKKLNQTGKTEPNRFCPKKTEPNRNRSVWTGFSFFFFNFNLVIFFE